MTVSRHRDRVSIVVAECENGWTVACADKTWVCGQIDGVTKLLQDIATEIAELDGLTEKP